MEALALLFLAVGALLLLIAAWGVIALPDALARQHAATKAGTLAVAFVGIGAALLVPDGGWWWRMALIVGFLLITLPLASHLLARAAVRESAAHRAALDRAPVLSTRGSDAT